MPLSVMGRPSPFQGDEASSSLARGTAGVVERNHAGLIIPRRRSNRTPATMLDRYPSGSTSQGSLPMEMTCAAQTMRVAPSWVCTTPP